MCETSLLPHPVETNREFFEAIGFHRSNDLLIILDDVDCLLESKATSLWSLMKFLK
jgi:hypothetical protein